MILSSPADPQSPQFRVLSELQCEKTLSGRFGMSSACRHSNPQSGRTGFAQEARRERDRTYRPYSCKINTGSCRIYSARIHGLGRDDRCAMHVALGHVHFWSGTDLYLFHGSGDR